MKYVIQGSECVRQGINPISVKFHIFPKIMKGVRSLKGASIICLTFSYSPYYRSSD